MHRIRSYEELDGGSGREVFFRPHRHRAADLQPLQCQVMVQGHSCALVDVSQNGVAFTWPKELPIGVNDNLAEVAVKFDDYVPFRGEARVGSVREVDGAMIVGVSFAGPLLPMDAVLELRTVRAFSGEMEQQETMRSPSVERFMVQVAELRHVFEDWRLKLDALEARLPWHVLNGDGPSPARDALIRYLKHTFVEEMVRRSEAIDAALHEAPPSQEPALKQFSRRQVHEFMMQSPCLHRMLHKPFGYPGDYEMMRFIYEGHFEGASLFGRAVNLAFVHMKAALAVKYRKDLVKRRLAEIIEAHRGSSRPLRLLSVAAGPAQELVEMLSETQDLAAPLEIVLFDQDKGALAYGWRRLTEVIEKRWRGRVQILFLHDSIKRLLRDADLFGAFGDFDAIYSCGLFDYLQAPTATVLTRNLFARLAPGGSLQIGNMAPDNPTRWIMEHHLDWKLIYRSRAEMTEIARRAAPEARGVRTLEEETGVNPFVEVTRG